MTNEKTRLTIPALRRAKTEGRRIAMISVPDYPMALWAERAGADVVVVGDSLGMTVYGYPNTLPVTMDQMVAHTQAVRRGAPETFCIVSMPYGAYATPEIGVANGLRLIREGGADAVKMQGGCEKVDVIRAIAASGVPVMSHVGMCPHMMHHYGGFKLQGRTADAAVGLIEDGRAIEAAGAIGFEIEAVPAPVARAIDAAVDIFTFGIGAGAGCTGQILLGADVMGAFDAFKPKFAKRYADVNAVAGRAFADYVADVHEGTFPDDAHAYAMAPDQEALLAVAQSARGQEG